MRIKTSKYILEVDYEKTKEYYTNAQQYECECIYCKNYIAAASGLPKETKEFLEILGIDYMKIALVSKLYADENKVSYDCYCRIAGWIMSNHAVEKRTQDNRVYYVRVVEEIAEMGIFFHDDRNIFYDCHDFPDPCFEMNFKVFLPWKLEKREELQ
ncbi:MAG: hypothetical protein K0R90_289 [Oscillospiraceae bacterium]|jgi:hypothetical protein|nr:hypothetical protein [Oscillospiraceae bacterium]